MLEIEVVKMNHKKFASNYRAGRKDAVHLYKFLKKHKINFGTIMQQEGEDGSRTG